jgi:drug/metabolite transporter (DMT)-like permease
VRFAGELAALGTAACWAAGSNFFAAAGRRMGSRTLNRLRLSLAFVFLALTLLLFRGTPWPTWATPAQVGLLAGSGLVGYVFGDANYFRSLVILGPGRATLLTSLSPLFTVLLGWPLLGEIPGRLAVLGIALTLGGVLWVLYDRQRMEHSPVEGSVAVGVVAGILGGVGQAGGYVLSKLALRSGLDPLSATVIRVTSAVVAVWAMALAAGDLGGSGRALRDRRANLFMVTGAFCGPYLGVLLSLVALKYIQAGVAASIIAFYPVLAILLASRFHGERITLGAIGGALVAAMGVVVLFLRH